MKSTDIELRKNTLPDTLEEISKRIHYDKGILKAYRAKLKVMETLGVTQEEIKKTLSDTQETAENLLLLEMKRGVLTKTMPKSRGGRGKVGSENCPTKAESLKKNNITSQ